MKHLIMILLLFAGNIQLQAQQSISTYQFWFDNDYANAQTGAMTSNQFSANIATNSLTLGMHKLHYRAKDSLGQWSSVVSQSFYKPISLDESEYWFDGNYGAKQTVSNLSANNFHLDSLINSSMLSFGFHTFFFRSKNEDGKWSSTVSQQFYIANSIMKYEYWFDNNYAGKVSQNLTSPTNNLLINDLISTSMLNGTEHIIHLRTQNQDGKWSTTFSQAFTTQNQMIAYEYWFNEDYQSKTTQSISPLATYELQASLDASQIPLGSNIIHIHFKDKNGKWSQVISEGFCRNTGDSSIHIKLLLQGYYSSSGIMNSVLMNQGIGNNPFVADSIDIELRNDAPPYNAVASTRVELNVDGTAKVDFPFNFIGSYYLALKHRNSIQTWSAVPIYRGNCPVEYDFTTAANKAYGNNMIEVENGYWALYTGELNLDDNIDLLDLSLLDNDITAFQFGYFSTDLNGDGNVDLLDSQLMEENINNFIFANYP